MPNNSERWISAALWGVMILGALLRVTMAGFHLHLNEDAAYLFLPCAERLVAGNWREGLDHTIPTGFLFLHAAWLALHGGETEFGARLLTALMGALCVPAAYLLARCFVGRLDALLAAAVVAINPQLVQYSGRISSEVPYALALTVAIWVGLVAIRRRGVVFPGAAGVTIGIAYLIRPEGLAVLPVVAAGLLIPFSRPARWSPRVVSMGTLGLTFLITASPMIWVNYRATGRFSLSNKGGISLERYEDAKAPTALTEDHRQIRLRYFLSREGYRPFRLGRVVREDPAGFAARCLRRLGVFLWKHLPRVMGVALTVGALLAIFLYPTASRRASRALYPYLGGFLVLYLSALSMFFVSDRFVLPLVPILAVLAAPALAATLRKVPVRWGLIALAVTLAIDGAHALRKLDRYDGFSLGWRSNPDRALGEELKRRYGATRILSPRGTLAYYADAVPIILPTDSYDAVFDYVRHQKVELIVYRKASRPNDRDSIHDFVQEWPENPAELTHEGVLEHSTPGGLVRVEVWRVK